MLHWLMSFYQTIMDYTKAFPMAQQALLTISSVSIAGILSFAVIKLPKYISAFFYSQCVTRLVFNTSGISYGRYNKTQYVSFLNWFSKNKWFKFSRVLTIDSDKWDSEEGSVGPGIGTHFFFFKYRLFFFTIIEQKSEGTELSKYKLDIAVVGRSKKPIYQLMDEFIQVPDKEKYVNVHVQAKESNWQWITNVEIRNNPTIVYDDDITNKLINPIKEWFDNKKWYFDRGIDYKFCALLYGQPGTGKSTIARELAFMLKKDIYIMSPDYNTDFSLLFSGAKGGILLIEDIDDFSITNKRTGKVTDVENGIIMKEKPKENDSDCKDDDEKSMAALLRKSIGGLSGLLNALQGVIPADDLIIIMTTNHPEKLDPALIRDGRVDVRIEIKPMTHIQIASYYKQAYSIEYSGEPFPEIPGATVSNAFLMNKNDPDGFVKMLLEHKTVSN